MDTKTLTERPALERAARRFFAHARHHGWGGPTLNSYRDYEDFAARDPIGASEGLDFVADLIRAALEDKARPQ